MRLTEEQIAGIKACENLYPLRATARHFGVSPATVHGIWAGERHTTIHPSEPPNVPTRATVQCLIDDINILLSRGMSKEEVAQTLNISIRSVYRANRRGVKA